jgi:DNA-binding SARP family transcriptional activator
VGNSSEIVPDEIILRVLGPVILYGVPLADTLSTKVLTVVALAAPNKVTMEELASAIWGEARPRTWSSSLRTHLSVARKLLRSNEGGFDILSDEGGFAMAGDLNRIDVVRFRSLVQVSRVEAEPQICCNNLTAALELWRSAGSDEFDSSFDLHFTNAHDHVSLDLLALTDEARRLLWKLQIELGHGVRVAHELKPLFHSNPADQSIAELFLKALSSVGSNDETVSAIGAHRRVMEQRGLEMAPVIQRISRTSVGELVAGTLEFLRFSGTIPNVLQRAQKQIPRAIGEVLCIGRVFVFMGQAGMGKSVALLQVAQQLVNDQVVVLFGSCEPNMQPLQPIEELLLPWRKSFDPTLLPSEDLVLGLLEREVNGPISFMIDDAHLLDLASVKLLRRVISRGLPEHVSVVLACRTDEGSQAVRRFLAELRSSPWSEFHDLGNFTHAEVHKFVQLRRPQLRRGEVRELSDQLVETSSGMPLLTELLLDADLKLEVARDDIAAHLEYEVDQLRPDHRNVLCVAALCGLQFDVSLVAEASGVTAALVFDAIDAGYRLGLLEKRERNRGRFRHELTRASLIASIGFEQKSNFHRRVGAVCATRKGDNGVVTEHLASALIDSQDPHDVIAVLQRVRVLEDSQDWEVAQRVLRLVSEAVSLQPWLQIDDIPFDLALLSALALQAAGDWGDARKSFATAFSKGQLLGRVDLMATVAFLSYGSNQPLDGDPERVNWLRTVYEFAEPGSEYSIRSAADLVYLEAIHDMSDYGMGLVDVLRTCVISESDLRLRGFAYHGLLVVDIGSAHINERQAMAQQMLANRDAYEPEVTATALLVLATTSLQLGDVAAATVYMDDCRLLAAQKGRAGDRWITNTWLAVLAEWAGDTVAADHNLAIALDLAERHELPDGFLGWVVFVAGRAMRTGDWTMLLPANSPISGRFEEHALDELCLGLCLDAVSGGTLYPEKALDVAVQRVATASRSVAWIPQVVSLSICAAIRGGEAARQCLELLTPYEGTVLFTPFLPAACFGPADLLLAKLAVAIGRASDAAKWFGSSDALCERIGLNGWKSDSAS